MWQGSAGAIVSALITAGIGLVVGNSGAASQVLPGSPTATVTVAGPAVTTTTTATVTETVTPSGSAGGGGDPGGTATVPVGAVVLADVENLPPDLVSDLRMSRGTNVPINGKTFDYGWKNGLGSSSSPFVNVSLNLNRSYAHFTARLGVLGTSEVNTGKIEVIADGTTVFSKAVTLQDSHDVDLDVSGVQRLEIKMFPPKTGVITYAVGNPVVTA